MTNYIDKETIDLMIEKLMKEKGFYEVSGINEFICHILVLLFITPGYFTKRRDYTLLSSVIASLFDNYKKLKISKWLLNSTHIFIINDSDNYANIIKTAIDTSNYEIYNTINAFNEQVFIAINKEERKIKVNIEATLFEIYDNRYSDENINLFIFHLKRVLGLVYRFHLGIWK